MSLVYVTIQSLLARHTPSKRAARRRSAHQDECPNPQWATEDGCWSPQGKGE
jgi:hypothetical protein